MFGTLQKNLSTIHCQLWLSHKAGSHKETILSFDAIKNKTQDKNFKHKIEILLAQTCLKDQSAFENLYQITSPKLYGLILKMIQDKEIAADILQESFSKIWHQSASYHSDFGENWAWSWICQITRK